jgi:hypothetical protein
MKTHWTAGGAFEDGHAMRAAEVEKTERGPTMKYLLLMCLDEKRPDTPPDEDCVDNSDATRRQH